MPIPGFDEDGFLPVGIHDAALHEIEHRFGRAQGTNRRERLFRSLQRYVAELQAWGHAREVIINGSFVTSKPDPGDIDMLVVLEPGFDFAAPMTRTEYNLLDHTRAKQTYGFDLFYLPADSPARDGMIEVFSCDSRRAGHQKGILRLAQ